MDVRGRLVQSLKLLTVKRRAKAARRPRAHMTFVSDWALLRSPAGSVR